MNIRAFLHLTYHLSQDSLDALEPRRGGRHGKQFVLEFVIL